VRFLLDRFQQEFGSTSCQVLKGYDFSVTEEHDQFIASGIWHTQCMQQIEFTLTELLWHEND
jgi:hypothetical protein